jgi:hypothetical protein
MHLAVGCNTKQHKSTCNLPLFSLLYSIVLGLCAGPAAGYALGGSGWPTVAAAEWGAGSLERLRAAAAAAEIC